MSRWIDADAVKEALKQNMPQYMWGEVLSTVNVQPYVDLVRCAECKHWRNIVPTRCTKHFGILVNADDFCSYGEREGE